MSDRDIDIDGPTGFSSNQLSSQSPPALLSRSPGLLRPTSPSPFHTLSPPTTMPRTTFADPVTSEPNERTHLKPNGNGANGNGTLPTYTYIDTDVEGGVDGDDGREVEVWKPGKSSFYDTVSPT